MSKTREDSPIRKPKTCKARLERIKDLTKVAIESTDRKMAPTDEEVASGAIAYVWEESYIITRECLENILKLVE